MEQLTYVEAGRLERREVPAPALQSGGEALVRPLAVATCDLDALIVRGFSPFQGPFALGHECVAEVVEVGDAVRAVEPGRRVSVPFQISCGDCPACRRGRTANCRTVTPHSTYGFGPAVAEWGGFLSDLVRIPYADHMLVPVPDALDPRSVASASDNIVDGWRAVGPPLQQEPGASVLVMGGAGPGSIGLYAAALAVALGADRVLYVDDDRERREVARRCGADVHEGELPDRLGHFPISVDASADPERLRVALRSTAPDGICTSTGIYFGEQPELPLLEMYLKGITFTTGRVHARPAIPHVLALAADGRFAPEEITTRVVDWSDAEEALTEERWTKLVIAR